MLQAQWLKATEVHCLPVGNARGPESVWWQAHGPCDASGGAALLSHLLVALAFLSLWQHDPSLCLHLYVAIFSLCLFSSSKDTNPVRLASTLVTLLKFISSVKTLF